MNCKQILFLFSILVAVMACQKDDDQDVDFTPIHDGYIRAVDISFLPMIEDSGIVFFDRDSRARRALTILRESGVNTVRVRLWHNPVDDHSSLEEVKSFAERIRAEDMKVWLCVHYSDTWADPGEQIIPSAWSGLSLETLLDSVDQYTRYIMREVEPDMIQVGNEINNGMLLPLGSRWNNESDFKSLVNTGMRAVRETDSSCKIMLHYAGLQGAGDFYRLFEDQDYDQIGISYYPIWHGKDLDELKTTMENLRIEFDKEIIVAETAYPFTLSWDDNTNNIVGEEDQLIPEYPATLEGQRDFFRKIVDLNKEAGGTGVAWWGAAWVAFDGPQSSQGSTWENQALFDFTNKITPAARVFRE